MRLQLRLLALCTVAALAAGCSNNDSPTSTNLSNNEGASSVAQCANTIGNRVWYDTNCNGLQDQDETTGPAGVVVTLINCDTQVERTTTTDANGNYAFTDVATDDYMICIDIPDGYKASLEDAGDDNLDSDINSEGCTGCRDYDCAVDDLSRDAGICVDENGDCDNTIGNRVWFDVNCNGIQDQDETGGPEGVKVTLRNCDTDETFVTTTDSDGNYEFTDVATGEYSICIEIPGGYEATLEDAGDDNLDSDINAEGCTGCREYDCSTDDLSRDAGLCEKKDPEEEDFEGCTPGFWRNHLTHWDATPYSPDDLVNDTFGCDLVGDDDATLGEVIDAPQTYGALAFHAVAALLNSTHPGVDFGLDAGEVMDAACDGDKSTLSEANEEGCPLSGGNTTGGGGGAGGGGGKKK